MAALTEVVIAGEKDPYIYASFNHLFVFYKTCLTNVMGPLFSPPTLEYLFSVQCAVDPPVEIGNGPYGRRRCVPITGGTVRGKYLNGEVLPVGADFMYVLEPTYVITSVPRLRAIGLLRRTKLYMSTPITLSRVMMGHIFTSGMLYLYHNVQCFVQLTCQSGYRTEGPRSGPPEVLKALMEGGVEVDSSQYWFHLHIKLETGHEKYKWMNNRLIIARAMRVKGEVAYDAYFVENT